MGSGISLWGSLCKSEVYKLDSEASTTRIEVHRPRSAREQLSGRVPTRVRVLGLGPDTT